VVGHAVGKTLNPTAARPFLRRAATNAARPYARLTIRRVERPLRLHLGSGFRYLEGWLNVDLVGAKTDVWLDLERPLPIGPGEVEAIFSEHLWEHLTPESGFRLLTECHRVLRSGGVFRIAVPDAGARLKAYPQRWRDGQMAPMSSINELFYGDRHKTMYDAETLREACRRAGFVEAEQRDFGESRLGPVDSIGRGAESLYIEAVR
jgi:predicted SAM-dependent methyltransferase